MVKVKAKADRAAAYLAAHQAHVAAQALARGEPSSTVMAPAVDRKASPARLQQATYRLRKLMKLVIIWQLRRRRVKLFSIGRRCYGRSHL